MNINNLLENLKINVKNKNIFNEAFTHSTFVNEKRYDKDYQKLEFLGDALLDLLTAKYIYLNHPKLSEGDMSILRAKVVNTKNLAILSDKYNLNQYVRFGNSKEELIHNEKIKADVFESLCAAIYINNGIDAINNFLKENVYIELDKYAGKEIKNPKTLLQEYLQSESRGKIIYKTEWDEKQKLFISKIIHDGQIFGKGNGKSKKVAEVEAAKNALDKTK